MTKHLKVEIGGPSPAQWVVTDAETGKYLMVRAVKIELDMKNVPVLTVETYDFTATVKGMFDVFTICPSCQQVRADLAAERAGNVRSCRG